MAQQKPEITANRGTIFDNIIAARGNTPLVRLAKLAKDLPGAVLAKIEAFNPMTSVKDRIGAAMLAAAERARECERRFSHDRPDGSGTETVFRQFGVRWSVMSENIYTDSYRDFNPDRILVNWMNSPGHRANILDRSVTHMGAGVHKGKNGMTYAVQLFRR